MPDTLALSRPTYDAVIVGARCAGASTALLLARAGLRVLLVDRGARGSDTLSTHALMRGAVLQLDRWGVLRAVEGAGTPTIEKTVFQYGDDTVAVDIAPRGAARGLYAPRRTVLDAALVDAAEEAGAEVRFGARLEELVFDRDGRVCGVVLTDARGERTRLAADVVIGADGRRSTVAERVGAGPERLSRYATATLHGYFAGLPTDRYHWFYGSGMGGGVIPTNEGLACVFVGGRPEEVTLALGGGIEHAFRSLMARGLPAMAEMLDGRAPVGRLHRFPGALGYLRRPVGPGWALVGDAGYFKDPITAHGITDALRDAELLARAVVAGGRDALEEYHRTRDALSTDLFEVTDAIASFGWDLDELQVLHRRLSREMQREVAYMDAVFEGGAPRSELASVAPTPAPRSIGVTVNDSWPRLAQLPARSAVTSAR